MNDKKKLFIPRKLNSNDSRYTDHNNSQPMVDGVRINQYDYEGNKTGIWEEYFSNGKLSSKGSYVDGKEDGYWEVYHSNGQLHTNGNYNNGKIDGYWEYYWDNGNLHMKGNYKDGKEDGVWDFYNSNGNLWSKELYHKNGFIEKLPLTENKKLFIPRKLSVSDSRYSDHNNSQPIKDGVRINQYDYDGNKTGYWEYYYLGGELSSKGNYKDGKKEGYWESYYSNGNLYFKGSYKNGLRDGYWEYYYDNGDLYSNGSYVDGKYIKELPLTENKKLFIPRKLNKSDSRYSEWNNSQKLVDGVRINQYDYEGNETGYWESYWDNGNLSTKGSYVDGEEDGYWETYHYNNGQLSSKGGYKNGKRYGKWEYYWDNGNLHMKGNFKNGREDGIWEFYNSNGYLWSKELYHKNGFIEKLPITESKKLFIPRRLNKSDSRYSEWNNSQPMVDGKRINQYDYEGNMVGRWGIGDNYGGDTLDLIDIYFMVFGDTLNGDVDQNINDLISIIRDDIHDALDENGPLSDSHFDLTIKLNDESAIERLKDLYNDNPITENKKLFIPRKLSKNDSRYSDHNNSQPIKDGVRINQYDYEGNETGYWEYYYSNDQIYSKGNYVNGKEDGYWEVYYDNGQLGSKGNYVDGIKDGYWEFYWSSGRLQSNGNYKNGEFIDDSPITESNKMNNKYNMGNNEKILKSFETQTVLNSKIWDGDKLKTKIRTTLIAIGEEFHKSLEIDVPIEDIIFTGSLANYNWSQYSDVDLHVLVDFENFDDVDLIKKYFDAKKAIWNDNHNIKIKGFDVELYAQDVNESHTSTGIYSVMNDEWIVKPKIQKFEIDKVTIKKKVKEFQTEYNRIVDMFRGDNFNDTKKALDKIKDRIKKFRKAGLDKDGEMSTENLVFKTMRRTDLLNKIYELGIKTTDKEFTIETLDESNKKLFIPRRLNKSDSRYSEWNNSQPIKDGVRINQYDIEGNKTGYWEEYYSDGNLYFKGSYKNGLRDGYWEYYYDNGKLWYKGEYKNGKADGYWETYFDNGKIWVKSNYVNGSRDGYWVWYYEDGGVYSTELFKDGDLVEILDESEIKKDSDDVSNILKNFKENFGLDIGFLMSFGSGINALLRNITLLIKDYTIQSLTSFEMMNLAIAMVVVYLRKNKSLQGFKNEMLSIVAFTTLMPAYSDVINSLLGNVDFIDAFTTIIKSASVYTLLTHFKNK
jgi:uncharacterized protein